MKKSTGGIWVAALGTLTAVCLLVGLIAVFVAVGQNGGCEVGQFTPGGDVWQPCSALNPHLVWGGALSAVGLVLAGFTGLAGAVVAALAGSPRDR
ncbi:hypothetical protein [Curtobacterium sp. MCBD17_008]|uniref:hypothetical protein n=1 Tax=Curtobacterium sp. MCBD17_008 TaxID=2175656 RepID=UPI000DA86F2E|nr:hypothetical protein [Curtobacterium sp. MCBD17_008]PZE90436.1 hypothetical protein DEI95_11805 [Curtobacterium sp. MCBD17_008]